MGRLPTFRTLSVRNYRLYFLGQTASLTGTWMQRLGQEWLVLELTGSGAWLGIVAALQFVPMLVLGPWGGVLADRVDKRRLIVVTQVVAGALALTLGLVVAFGLVELWMVCTLALGLGIVTAIDNPARQSFVVELVDEVDVQNAVTLYSMLVNAARAVGPALAGALIAAIGLASSFLLNGLSFVAVIVALERMETDDIRRPQRTTRSPGQLGEGLRHIWRTPTLRMTLTLMTVVGMLGYEFSITLPLMAKRVFDGDAATLGFLNAALGAGAVVGGLAVASRPTATMRTLTHSAAAFGTLLVATSLAPSLTVALITLFVTGMVSLRLMSGAKTILQLHAAPGYRGRVMAFWAVAMLGTTAVGGPIIGWVGEVVGARAGLMVGGFATTAVALWGLVVVARTHPEMGIQTSPWSTDRDGGHRS